MKRALVLLLTPLLLAQSQPPAYLEHTKLPPAFTLPFRNYILNEVAPPAPKTDNLLEYLETVSGGKTTLYMRSSFAQSALIPGAPISFKDTAVQWFVIPDPEHQGLYTARVYSINLKEWALVAINLGPPRRDLVQRYHDHLTVGPLSSPTLPLPVGNPSDGTPVEWFLTAGQNCNGTPQLVQPDKQGYFAMLTTMVKAPDGQRYKQPYSLVGGGAGALHQAYGQLLYRANLLNLSPGLTPNSFQPPSGYKPVPNAPVPGGNELVASNCAVCHVTDPNYPTQLFGPQ